MRSGLASSPPLVTATLAFRDGASGLYIASTSPRHRAPGTGAVVRQAQRADRRVTGEHMPSRVDHDRPRSWTAAWLPHDRHTAHIADTPDRSPVCDTLSLQERASRCGATTRRPLFAAGGPAVDEALRGRDAPHPRRLYPSVLSAWSRCPPSRTFAEIDSGGLPPMVVFYDHIIRQSSRRSPLAAATCATGSDGRLPHPRLP